MKRFDGKEAPTHSFVFKDHVDQAIQSESSKISGLGCHSDFLKGINPWFPISFLFFPCHSSSLGHCAIRAFTLHPTLYFIIPVRIRH